MSFALSDEQLNVFKWVHEHDLVVTDADMIRISSCFNILQVVRIYLSGEQATRCKLRRRNFEMAEWLYLNGHAGKFTSAGAACEGVLRGMYEASTCNFDVLEWILQQNPSTISPKRLRALNSSSQDKIR